MRRAALILTVVEAHTDLSTVCKLHRCDYPQGGDRSRRPPSCPQGARRRVYAAGPCACFAL